jgi:hypothetical protein
MFIVFSIVEKLGFLNAVYPFLSELEQFQQTRVFLSAFWQAKAFTIRQSPIVA